MIMKLAYVSYLVKNNKSYWKKLQGKQSEN